MDLSTGSSLIASGIVIGGAMIGGFWRTLRRIDKVADQQGLQQETLKRHEAKLDKLTTTTEDQNKQIFAINYQLNNNGGKTVKDTVERIDRKTEKTIADMTKLGAVLDQHLKDAEEFKRQHP